MTADDISGRIRDELKAAGGTLSGPRLGKNLGSAVRAAYTTLGFSQLSAFVRKHLADEVDVQAGGIFQLRGAASGSADAPGSPSPAGDLFKTWKSPTSRLRVRVRLESGAVYQAPAGTQLVDGEKELAGPSGAFHAELGKRFVEAEVPEGLRQTFDSEISAATWWPTWNTLFAQRTADFPGGQRKWLTFRHEALVAELKAELERVGLSPEVAEATSKTILASGAAKKSSDTGSLPALRASVMHAVERLSDEELRRIWLPVGLLFDQLKRNS